MSVLDGHLHLFKLAWVRNPQLLAEQARVTGVTDPYVAEMAAWCAELHLHLNELSDELGLPLLLMGGNAAALRVEVARQRGSADNDYLTSASREDLVRLTEAFAERFSAVPTPFFRPESIEYTGDEPLPLMSYKVYVPQVYGTNPRARGELMVKVEFHIEEDLPLPPYEVLRAERGTVGEEITAKVPLIPYQLVLKLMTLVEPPVGIDPTRDDAVPRQIYDLDALYQKVLRDQDWTDLHEYAKARYLKEVRQRDLDPVGEEPWHSIDARLADWTDTARGTRQWSLINAFQSAQVGGPTQRTQAQWRARVQRVRFATRCAAMGTEGFALWTEALRAEALIPEKAQGKELKRGRQVLAPLAGVSPTAWPGLRNFYWEALAFSSVDLARVNTMIEAVESM